MLLWNLLDSEQLPGHSPARRAPRGEGRGITGNEGREKAPSGRRHVLKIMAIYKLFIIGRDGHTEDFQPSGRSFTAPRENPCFQLQLFITPFPFSSSEEGYIPQKICPRASPITKSVEKFSIFSMSFPNRRAAFRKNYLFFRKSTH